MIRLNALSLLALLALSGCRDGNGAPAATATHASASLDTFATVSSRAGMLDAALEAAPSPTTLDGQPFASRVYNGSYLPPVLRLQPGDSLKLRLVNRLPNEFSNLHYHGTAVSPRAPSDDIFLHVASGSAYDYRVYFPPDHDRGLFWYHPHAHGHSEEQVLGGMSGVLVVEGFLERFYPWLRDVPERIVMLKAHEPPDFKDGQAHTKTLNGRTHGTIPIRPGELQFWRIANIAADAYFNLRIDGARLWLLANDANPLRQPQRVDSILLPPGARAELILEGPAPGRYTIRHQAYDTGPQGDPNPAVALGTLVSAGPPVERRADSMRLDTPSGDIDTVASEIAGLRSHAIARRRTVVFSETADGNTFFVDGRQFDPSRVDTQVRLGDVEEWTIENTSREVHTFHVHQTDFLVTEIDGVPQPADGLHDTVNLPIARNGRPGSVKITIPFTDPHIIGKFVYHCHILEHEDGGMMATLQVTSSAAAATPKPRLPVRVLDRPTTLPAAALRLDALFLGSRVPGSSFATTGILGGGWGLTSSIEIGGQLVPVALSPTRQYTNPSLYVTYGHTLNASTTLAPTLQTVFPLRSGDPLTIDVGAALSVNVGEWGEVAMSPTLSLDLHGDGNGTSLSLPLTVMRQASTRFNWQLGTAVGFSRFDPRFALSRRSDALDFNDVTIPFSAQVMYTVPRDESADALVDLSLQGQLPQLYTNRPELRGWQTNDWTVQLQSSWYFLRSPRTAAPETAARAGARRPPSL